MEASPDVTLLGTGHVFDLESRILGLGWALRPDLVAIELDAGRLRGLEAKERGVELPKAGGPLLRYVSGFQERMAAEEGVVPGADMLAGRTLAKALGVPLQLMDRPMDQTLAKLKSDWPLRERIKVIGSSLWEGIKPGRKSVEEQLGAYMADPSRTLAELGDRAPNLHRILVQERDEWMARQLVASVRSGRRVLGILGDAHREGVAKRLRDQGLRVQEWSLEALEKGSIPQADAPVWQSA